VVVAVAVVVGVPGVGLRVGVWVRLTGLVTVARRVGVGPVSGPGARAKAINPAQ
jgi:hypothetical protein